MTSPRAGTRKSDPATTRLEQPAATVAAVIWLITPTLYFGIEWYTSRMFSPYYSYVSRFTSDLGIPYAYNDPDTGHLINSWRAVMMNLNFAANGLLFLTGNICLLRARGQKKLSTARLVNAVLYCIGIILVGAVAGGPKEHESGSVIWHAIGAGLAIIGGNVNSLLAGFAAPADSKPVYRTISLCLGTAGLSGLGIFFLLGNGGMKGFWQRSSIYPTLFWEYSTALSLVLELIQKQKDMKREIDHCEHAPELLNLEQRYDSLCATDIIDLFPAIDIRDEYELRMKPSVHFLHLEWHRVVPRGASIRPCSSCKILFRNRARVHEKEVYNHDQGLLCTRRASYSRGTGPCSSQSPETRGRRIVVPSCTVALKRGNYQR